MCKEMKCEFAPSARLELRGECCSNQPVTCCLQVASSRVNPAYRHHNHNPNHHCNNGDQHMIAHPARRSPDDYSECDLLVSNQLNRHRYCKSHSNKSPPHTLMMTMANMKSAAFYHHPRASLTSCMSSPSLASSVSSASSAPSPSCSSFLQTNRSCHRRSRRRSGMTAIYNYLPTPCSLLMATHLLLIVMLLFSFTAVADSCSSRSTPRARPFILSHGHGVVNSLGTGLGSMDNPSSATSLLGSAEALNSFTARPNVTFQTYACPENYAKWYCLNGATCFALRIGESILYNCECAEGYMGQRCEFKDLDGSYLHRAGQSTTRR